MANIDHKPSKVMLNLQHVLPSYANEDEGIVNGLIEINSGTINKYEIITESGQLKLDRVGYSSLAYPISYGLIPQTWDLDNDLLDVIVANVHEPLAPGCLAELRIIGVMKFNDGGEQDDKIITVLNDDIRCDHIKSVADLGEHWLKENTYYWEHYKHLKKPGTGQVEGFFDVEVARKVIAECQERYNKDYAPKFE